MQMASHDRYMKAARSFLILLILYVELFEQLDYLEVPMVHCVVEAVEALCIQFVQLLFHRTLHEQLYDVQTRKSKRNRSESNRG